MDPRLWYKGRIVHGDKLGRVIGYPTLNFENPDILQGQKTGVYASRLQIGGKQYTGALYFGPKTIQRTQENVLEIFVFDFNGNVYDETVSFTLEMYIRDVRDFPDFETLKSQLEKDCKDIAQYFQNASQ